jgi:hypothetical protein
MINFDFNIEQLSSQSGFKLPLTLHWSRSSEKIDFRRWVTASAFLAGAGNGRFRENRKSAFYFPVGLSRLR